MSGRDYLQATEPAVEHLFDGLNAYDSPRLPSLAQFIDESGVVRMTRAENKAFMAAYGDFFALEFARATLAGAILQVAYIGLKMHSPNIEVSDRFSALGVAENPTAKKLCLGREVHGIPIGLLIYAGRVQYNHWEEGEPTNRVVRKVFQELVMAYYDSPDFDMAYVLDYPSPRPVSHYIVRIELGWRIYDEYVSDMNLMLQLS